MSSIGELLFNKLYILFISAALLLFIAMIGVIVLTLDKASLKQNARVLPQNFNFKLNSVN